MKLRERESNLKKQRQDEIQKTLSCTYLDKDINNLLIELDTVKEDLEQIVNNQTSGAIIRSHAEHCEGNERNSKYFLSLEKRNYKNKCINKLVVNDIEIVSQEKILNEERHFYENLYASKEDPDKYSGDSIFFDLNFIPKLTDLEKDICDADISESECVKELYNALVHKNFYTVVGLLGRGASVNYKDGYDGATPLHKAVKLGNVAVADLLIKNRADTNAPDRYVRYQLCRKIGHIFCKIPTESHDIVIRMMKKGVTPLHKAAIEGNVEIAELLIRNKADVNAPDNFGATPLHKAAMQGSVDVTDILIHNNATVNVTDSNGKKSLDLLEDACKTSYWYIKKDEGNSPLHQAASEGQENVVKVLVGLGANVSAVNIEGNSPLHQAASKGQENMVKVLVGLGANVSAVNIEGNSPLHQAASKGQENVVKVLVGLGANVSAVNIEGNSPLHQAASTGKENVVKALVGLGANVSAVNIETLSYQVEREA
ncbi:unnamed protein product [Mytilus edulis]|uniref:Uncharacterized protein n=1 Tax=Mytilus edulis TaxID=6550 RepID=A0A8S3SFJ7_MYTED|nr:unnamed protein product [Mytilus edulis]